MSTQVWKDPPRYQKLKQLLLTEVKSLEPGSKLGSVKGMMDRYKVSQVTVDKALASLKEEGVVESRIGMGTYVAYNHEKRLGKQHRSIDLLVCGNRKMIEESGFHHDLISKMGTLLGESRRWLRVTVLPRDMNQHDMTAEVEKLEINAAIVLYMNNPVLSDFFAARKIPCLLLVPYWPVNMPNSFVVDNRRIAKCWVEHLSKLGHRRIAYLHGVVEDQYNRDMSERLQMFYEEMARAGILVDPDLVVYGGFSREEGYEGARKLLSNGSDFTAVIINDHAAGGVYQAFQEAGLSIGSDVSIIGTDDLSWAAHMHPPMTTVRISRTRLANMALEKLDEIISGEMAEFSCEMIPVSMIERESAGPVSGIVKEQD